MCSVSGGTGCATRFRVLASGAFGGLAGLAVNILNGDILAADGAADGDLALARLLAQRDFLDHVSLLGNHRLFRGRGHLDRALAERLVGLLRLQGALDPAALNVNILRSYVAAATRAGWNTK